ncbi:MAG TPA: carboxylating nicotinate-nucleotide diphosphorylase [Verrucomicrobiales bacterium]|nr:carboxylating nicotinate-nucleotide diphosphorylase [Verrucomicrobiales bacterium]|tara:strand:- start:2563 stop:3420 length:858 start_codon:yes stop_codon:yes gene_type:complete
MHSDHSSLTDSIIELALKEDLGERGDISSQFFIKESAIACGRIIAKEDCVISGSEIAALVFNEVNPNISIEVITPSGKSVTAGETILISKGPARSILTAERTALNFLQRLSGIATLTRKYVNLIDGTRAKIFDTRKTTPGMRVLEKAAVVAGGGYNHRHGLYDMAMLKDNHFASEIKIESLQIVIDEFKEAYPDALVELEADTISQVTEFLSLENVDVIMLDNMSLKQISEAVQLSNGNALLEASGGINLETVAGIAETGIDRISVGALTHSAKAIDLAMDFEQQ